MNSVERRVPTGNDAICAGGYVLRDPERCERGEECFGPCCPHPTICTTRHRELLALKVKDKPCG